MPKEIVQQTGDETETSGKGKLGLPNIGIGAGGERRYLDTDNVETRITISAPYRFEELRESILDEEIPIYDDSNGGSLARGDVVEITGDVNAMALFRFELVIRAFLDVMDAETYANLEELDAEEAADQLEEEELTEEDIGEIQILQQLVRKFSGDEIPLRLDIDGHPFGIALDRNHMRENPASVFLENREYTIFGRVESTLTEADEWDPTTVTNILDKYVPEERTGEEFRREFQTISNELDMQMDTQDMLIEGPGSIIHPIAIYW